MIQKPSIAPWLSVSNGGKAADFYKDAFGTIELYRHEEGEGQLVIAQLSINGADFWIQEDSDSSTESIDGGAVRMIMTVEDPDSVFEQALSAGANEVIPINDAHGWRIGRIVDPFGHHWEIGKQLVDQS